MFKLKKNFLRYIIIIFISLLIIELTSNIFYSFYIEKQFTKIKQHKNFYYEKTKNEQLGYQLKKNISFTNSKNQTATINKYGIREITNIKDFNKPIIGILGDSVVFGVDHSDETTIPYYIQKELPNYKILNLGVPGYSLEQFQEHIKYMINIYDIKSLLFILNLNDFSRRNTFSEGGDAGLYRMFYPPKIKTLFLFNKLIYRLSKGSLNDFNVKSLNYYKLLFYPYKKAGFNNLLKLKNLCDKNKIKLKIFVLPSGFAYQGEDYKLNNLHALIINYLNENNISVKNLAEDLNNSNFNLSDHLNIPGNKIVSQLFTLEITNLK